MVFKTREKLKRLFIIKQLYTTGLFAFLRDSPFSVNKGKKYSDKKFKESYKTFLFIIITEFLNDVYEI